MVQLDLMRASEKGLSEVAWLALGCFAGEEPMLDHLPEPVAAEFRKLTAREGWTGTDVQGGETLLEGQTLLLRGLGESTKWNPDHLAAWLGRLAEGARANEIGALGVVVPPHPQTHGRAAAVRVFRILAEATYRYRQYRSTPKVDLGRLEVLPPPGQEEVYRDALDEGRAVAAGVELTRDLTNTPPNEAHPEWLAEQCRGLAEEEGLGLEILGPTDFVERGMGGMLAVGRGSRKGPRLVRLDYEGGDGPLVALVGKGVTFDSGGLSLKPGTNMSEMKYDKAGACAVVGAVKAVARLKLPIRLRAYVALAENMPDGDAYRPGDIVRCYNGKTVEIINTDAEGRMILADALTWAAEEKPAALVELSTLTGGAVVALGLRTAALYSPDENLAAELLGAGEAAGERLWRMPLLPEDLKTMKGTHGDLKNAGPRWGSANTAASFLGEFVGGVRKWAHIDIAGPAYVRSEGRGTHGATGFGVPFLVSWLSAR